MALTLDQVTVRRGGRAIVDRLDLTLRAGEMLAMVGPNGAGKSTALAVAAGVAAADGGTVTLDGRPIAAHGMRALARRRAVVPQSSDLAFPFRVHEVVALGRAPHRGFTGAREDARIVDAMLARFGLAALAERDVITLSGGERQRVALARAFAQVARSEPRGPAPWLFLDEPIAALDPAHQVAILSAAAEFARAGGGVLAVLHDLRLASAYADRIAMLDQGALVAAGPPHAVLTPERVTRAFALAHADLPLFLTPAKGQPGARTPSILQAAKM